LARNFERKRETSAHTKPKRAEYTRIDQRLPSCPRMPKYCRTDKISPIIMMMAKFVRRKSDILLRMDSIWKIINNRGKYT
jgi:hypothetical protein